jgi:LPS-assembly protein
MIRLLMIIVAAGALGFGLATPAAAQVNVGGFDRVVTYKQEQLGDGHYLLTGAVELERGDTSIYADSVEYFEKEDRAIATGNVVITQGNNRIAADRADFNTRTQLGTFYSASGIATVRQGRLQSPVAGGISVPPMSQENDVYYFGETVEKIGPRKYRITNGGFSTCVQPTPRWDLSADTIVLNLDHYTLLKQVLLNVKGVPMLYLPFMYYPTNDEDRATGFLIPTYGMSTLRGQSIHNAFFWAINRSQDATFMYDWYSKTGTGSGGEYRYNYGTADGQLSGYLLDEHAATYTPGGGAAVTNPAARSYTLRGNANQLLPGRFRARASVDYFSNIITNQTFNSDINRTAQNTRRYGANVVGYYKGVSVNGTYERNEWFGSLTSSSLVGRSPSLALTRTERPILPNWPIYLGATSEFAHLDRQTLSDAVVVDDRGLSRFDVMPQIRYPFKSLTFLTVNTTAAVRETYYTRSLAVPGDQTKVVDTALNRRYFTLSAQAVGPVFSRVFDTPDNGYASRWKHTIEPYVTVQRTSNIDNDQSIVVIDGTDTVVGGTTSYSYGLNNRLYAKRPSGSGQTAVAQEILAVGTNQSYYTNARASQVDPRYSSATAGAPPSNFSPVAISLRATPSTSVDATVRAEIDSHYRELRTISANGRLNLTEQLQASVGWSKRFFIADLPYFNDRNNLDHSLNVSTNLQTRDRRYGSQYSMSWDIHHATLVQQRITAFYNAQCCGIAAEYQRFNYPGLPAYIVASQNRFFLSFTLAGLGNFSPFSGGLNGVPR